MCFFSVFFLFARRVCLWACGEERESWLEGFVRLLGMTTMMMTEFRSMLRDMDFIYIPLAELSGRLVGNSSDQICSPEKRTRPVPWFSFGSVCFGSPPAGPNWSKASSLVP